MRQIAKPGDRIVYMGEAKVETTEKQPGGIRLQVTGFGFNFGTVETVTKVDGFAEGDDSFYYTLKGHGHHRFHADLCRVVGLNQTDFEIIQNALKFYRTAGAGAGLTEEERDAAKRIETDLRDFHYA